MFLDDVVVTQADINKARRDMSHWVKLAEQLYKCSDEPELKRMIITERMTTNRAYVIRRIYAHYNAIRAKREREEVMTWSLKP